MTIRRWQYQAAIRDAVFGVPEGRISPQDTQRAQIISQQKFNRQRVRSGSFRSTEISCQVTQNLIMISYSSFDAACWQILTTIPWLAPCSPMSAFFETTLVYWYHCHDTDRFAYIYPRCIAEHLFIHSPIYDLSPTTSLFQRSSSSVQGSTSGSGPSGVILFGLISKWDLL